MSLTLRILATTAFGLAALAGCGSDGYPDQQTSEAYDSQREDVRLLKRLQTYDLHDEELTVHGYAELGALYSRPEIDLLLDRFHPRLLFQFKDAGMSYDDLSEFDSRFNHHNSYRKPEILEIAEKGYDGAQANAYDERFRAWEVKDMIGIVPSNIANAYHPSLEHKDILTLYKDKAMPSTVNPYAVLNEKLAERISGKDILFYLQTDASPKEVEERLRAFLIDQTFEGHRP